jgi:uncharacterized protein YecE (DUF72 family)
LKLGSTNGFSFVVKFSHFATKRKWAAKALKERRKKIWEKLHQICQFFLQ